MWSHFQWIRPLPLAAVRGDELCGLNCTLPFIKYSLLYQFYLYSFSVGWSICLSWCYRNAGTWLQTLRDGVCAHLRKVFGSPTEAAAPQYPPCRAELNLFLVRILVSRHFGRDVGVGDILKPFTETGIFWWNVGTIRLQLGLFPQNKWVYLNKASSSSWLIRLRRKTTLLLLMFGMANAAGKRLRSFPYNNSHNLPKSVKGAAENEPVSVNVRCSPMSFRQFRPWVNI